MARQIFTVFETDAWHSTAKKEFKGVFTSRTAAVNAIVKYHATPYKEATRGRNQTSAQEGLRG